MRLVRPSIRTAGSFSTLPDDSIQGIRIQPKYCMPRPGHRMIINADGISTDRLGMILFP